MKRASRREIARAVTKQLVDGADPKTIRDQLAAYMVEHKMTNQLDMLMQDIATELQAETGRVSAIATTAFAITPETQRALERRVAELTSATSVELQLRQDPTLVGGAIIDLPGQQLDISIRRKLISLSQGEARL